VRAGYRIRYHLQLPEGLADDRTRRSEETVPYQIATEVWLGAGERRLEFVTRVNNTARDHRLRVLFPTPIRTDMVHADGHFDVVTRPMVQPAGEGWAELPSPTAHQRTFVDVSDGQRGLAVLNRGLPEYEAVQGAEGTGIALTLLRCVGWLSRDDLSTRPGPAGYHLPTPEAQCSGEHEFHYAAEPHADGWEAVIHDAYAFNAPCTVVGARTGEGLLPADTQFMHSDPDTPEIVWEPLPRDKEMDVLPPHGSFVTLEPAALILSSVRTVREGRDLEVRCYNPTDRGVTGRLQLSWPPRRAALVNFLGEEEQALVAHDGAVEFEARAKGIFTIRCELENRL
jgi:alpha-mannosidase